MIALHLLLAAARYETAVSSDQLLLLRDNNKHLEAAISPAHGGELASLVLDRVELLYLGRDYSPRQGFAGKAMFLWPATGPVTGMPMHGFAKEHAWTVVEHQASANEAHATLRFTDSEATRRYHPYGFALTVRYELHEGGLTLAYTVEAAAANTQPMPFAIGNHVAFNLPLTPKGQPGRVTFESSCRTELLRDKSSLPTGETKPWRHAGSATPLSAIHAVPAISLAECGRTAKVRLKDPSGLTLDVTHHGDSLPKMPVVQFNLYGGVEEGYFSPEPWIGLQGGYNSQKGLTRLAPGQRWRWTIGIKPLKASAASSPPPDYR